MKTPHLIERGFSQGSQAVPLLSEAERRQLLIDGNNTQKDYSTHQLLHHLFEAQVDRTPGATAIVFEQPQLSYRELDQRANQLAHHLIALGVGPEVLVGLYAGSHEVSTTALLVRRFFTP